MDGFPVDAVIVAAIIALIGLLANGMYFEPKRAREDRKNEWDRLREEREFQRQKQETEKENRKKELRDALYSEMANVYCMIKKIIDSSKNSKWLDKQSIDQAACFDVYESTRRNPVIFYQLEDAQEIDRVYRELQQTLIRAVLTAEKGRTRAYSELQDYMESIYDDLLKPSGIEISRLIYFMGAKECSEYKGELERKNATNDNGKPPKESI